MSYGIKGNMSDSTLGIAPHQVLKAIAALAEGLRARDAQLNALSEQMRLGFDELRELREAFKSMGAKFPILATVADLGDSECHLAEQVRLLDKRLESLTNATINGMGNLAIAQERKPARKPKKGKKR
jgi:hypothetical protein